MLSLSDTVMTVSVRVIMLKAHSITICLSLPLDLVKRYEFVHLRTICGRRLDPAAEARANPGHATVNETHWLA